MGRHDNPKACGICGGSGSITVNLDSKKQKIKCATCNGSGNA